MMDLQTSTLTLSFWNMSRNGRKRSWRDGGKKATMKNTLEPSFNKKSIVWGHAGRLTIEKRTEKLWKYRRIFLIADCSCKPNTEWRWTDSLLNEQSVSKWAAYLRISILKCPVRGHVFDDVSQDGIDFTFLGANKRRTVQVNTTHNVASILFRSTFSLWSVGRWTPPRSQHSWCNPKKNKKKPLHVKWVPPIRKIWVTNVAFLQHLRASDFGDHLPGFIQDCEPLRLWGVGTGETASQRPKQKVLDMGKQQCVLFSSFKVAGKPTYESFC